MATDRARACPYVNQNDARCGSRFALGRIDQAFSVCFGAFHGCPMFHRISREQEGAADVVVLTALTREGHVLPLRATGT